ncbi:MAG TPA: amidohydrolase family protein [Acidimicrobiia bacterium]|nr:amidohydrolase family protein [Acidimicrobiia bacterium]
MKYSVISADSHLMEPKDLFVERLPREYRDRAPRVLRGRDGGDGWSFDGEPPRRTFGLEAVAGQKQQGVAFGAEGLTWEQILPGNYEGAAAVADMDRDGVDASVLYSGPVGLSSFSLPDREFALAVMRTYNDWLLDDFCSIDADRLVGLALLPTDDGQDVMLAEFERCVAKKARGFNLPGSPEQSYFDPYYDPLWEAASNAGIPLSFHRNHGGRPKGDLSGFRPDIPGVNVGGIVARFFTAIDPFTYMIFTGVFERFPDLRIIGAEVNCGWLPFWRENMDQNYEQQRDWANVPINRRPSEFVGRNVFVTTLDDRYGYDAIRRDPSLADAVMYSTDYPHSVTLWPNSATLVEELTEGFDEATRHKVLAGNAVSLYHLDGG